jgi:hypothetical protein
MMSRLVRSNLHGPFHPLHRVAGLAVRDQGSREALHGDVVGRVDEHRDAANGEQNAKHRRRRGQDEILDDQETDQLKRVTPGAMRTAISPRRATIRTSRSPAVFALTTRMPST